jgi:hypothetical protein
MMQDTLRFLVEHWVKNYTTFIEGAAQGIVDVVATNRVKVQYHTIVYCGCSGYQQSEGTVP